jgi:riboflavin biosynthesis pyrimidine reductase
LNVKQRPLIIANLILGRDGSTSKNGSSIGLSTPADRKLFHQLRSESSAILIGGNTARREPYKKTTIPLYIITHSKLRLQPKNQLAKQLNLDPQTAIDYILDEISDQPSAQLLIEAGPKLLLELIQIRVVNKLYLTINQTLDGENKIDLSQLTASFKLISTRQEDGCEFQILELTN